VPNSKLMDCPPHDIDVKNAWRSARNYDHVIINTSTPSLKNDCKVAEAIKQQKPGTKIGFVGAHAAVLPAETLKASRPLIGWAARNLISPARKSPKAGRCRRSTASPTATPEGKIIHNREREMIADMDVLPWVVDTYKRDLQIEKYFIGYLLHPYLSLYTGRGCPAQCTFCLWPQTIGGHKYRVRSPENVAAEMAHAKKLFPQVQEFFFDDDTFTANLPRAREIAKKLAPLGLTWSCNSRANLDYDTIKSLQGFRPAPVFGRLRKRQPGNPQPHQKGIQLDEARRFTKACHKAGVVIHGTFILGLPVETRETIEQTIRYAMDLDVFSIQVSLAAPYPGTELYEMARQNGWFAKKDKTDIVHDDGFQQSSLEYPGLNKDEIFEAVDRFYRAYYLRPKPILRIIKTMLEDKDIFVRRCREGYEFFKSLNQRKVDLAASRAVDAQLPRWSQMAKIVAYEIVSSGFNRKMDKCFIIGIIEHRRPKLRKIASLSDGAQSIK
jgi:radical SAM superfamily enzyme YgiQ (UPF0313 family)